MKTIGFFGGTFDPIHFGHIHLAIQLMEAQKLDEVLFCPAYCSPLKTDSPPFASPHHRLQMVKLAIQDIPHFHLTSYEADREVPSYTVDTLKHLQGENGDTVHFRLILSEEAAERLEEWKDFRQLLKIAPPLIGTRSACHLKTHLAGVLKAGYTQTQRFEISSTEIRRRLKLGLYCGHLLPDKTLDYIQAHRLYSA